MAKLIRQLSIYPDLLCLHHAHAQRYPFLLESVAHGTSHARYDILFAFPGATLALTDNDTLQVAAAPDILGNDSPRSPASPIPGMVPPAALVHPCTPDFLQNLDVWWEQASAIYGADENPSLPFSGGWFIYLGYELAGQIEPRLALAASDIRDAASSDTSDALPIAFATRIPAAIIVDHHMQCTFLVAEDAYAAMLDEMAHDLAHLTATPAMNAGPVICQLREDAPTHFLEGVQRVKEYIVAGDVFQVNLSRTYQATLAPDMAYMQLYQNLRKRNPAPFAGVALYKGNAILSSSPERLLRVHNDMVEVRPIAGTHPRGMGDEDLALSQALLAHPKERAEHVMLIDLERNDLGRVCVPGSVQVDELMVLESYAHVHHIVSNVRGIKRPGITPGQVIRAVFPGGTITGCPKVRCMEIIAELEQSARGPYTGAMGYLNHNGNMDLNILIRTMWVKNDNVQFRVGAGIVADSVPDAELQETRAKARGLLLALGEEG